MDTCAATFLKQTFLTVLGIPQKLSRLLQKSDTSEKDLESQVPPSPLLFGNEALLVSSKQPFENLLGMDEAGYQDDRDTVLSGHRHETENTQGMTPYADGPARVVLHNARTSKTCLALTVNKEMVSMIGEVAKHKQILRERGKLYAKLVGKLSDIERAILEAEANLREAKSKDESQKLQQDIEGQKSRMQRASTERDLMADDLRVFKLNVEIAQDAAQAFFEPLFGGASLIEIPRLDSVAASSELQGTGSHSPASSGETDGSDRPSPEELFRQAAQENLMDQREELLKAQRQWDTWPSVCDRERQIYEELLANGEPVPAQSDFDRSFLKAAMDITACLIKTEKEFEMAKEHAIATGAIDEDWGKPQYYDEFDAQSWTNEEEIAYQQSKDWSHVDDWRHRVSAIPDGRLVEPTYTDEWVEAVDPNLFLSEPIDIDEWDAEPIDLRQDSISVVAYNAYQSKNIRRWQAMIGHR